jgi:hypothetical protein
VALSPFAGYEGEWFDGPSSRDRLISATCERYPSVWAETTTL